MSATRWIPRFRTVLILSLLSIVSIGSAQAQVTRRINAAGPDFTDSNGHLFVADKAYVAGDFGYVGSDNTNTFENPISGTIDDTLYQSMRGGLATFSYVFDSLPVGDYLVRLYFTEPSFTAGVRIFDVQAESVVVLDDVDIAGSVEGTFNALELSFTLTVSDGQLNLDFIPVTAERAIISAIEVIALGPLWYENVTAAAGIVQSHDLDESICLTIHPPIGSGAAFADYDGDNDQDLFVTNHGAGPHYFYRNDGDTNMDGIPDFTDVAVSLGLDDPTAVGHSAVFIDYDNDGDQDLYVTAWGGNTLWENQLVESGNVAATFIDVTATAGLIDYGRGVTTAWGDFNEDGFLDVFITKHFYCMPFFPSESEDILYMNNGDGTFTDVTDYLCGGAGMAPCAATQGYGFSAGWVDYDNDSDLDLYLVNDDLLAQTGHWPNVLWRNDGPDGSGGWLFADVSVASGTNISANGMGLGVGDYDNDGLLDLSFSNSKAGPNYLLQNQGNGTFLNTEVFAGVDWFTTPQGDGGVTWGTVFFDYDNDQWLDLYFVAGETFPLAILQPNPFFVNDGDGTFQDMSAQSGLDEPGRGRAGAIADIDGDGFVDVFVGNYGEPPHLFLSRAIQNGNTNHWLTITVEGTVSNRDGIGTRIDLTTPDAITQIREITSGPTHGGGDQKAAFFGLGSNTSADVVVTWPNGVVENVGTVTAIDQTLHCVEGSCAGCAVPPDPTGLFLDRIGNDVRLTWQGSGSGGATWNVYRDPARDPGSWGAAMASGVTDEDGGTPGIQYTDVGGVLAGTVQHYLVTETTCAESPLR